MGACVYLLSINYIPLSGCRLAVSYVTSPKPFPYERVCIRFVIVKIPLDNSWSTDANLPGNIEIPDFSVIITQEPLRNQYNIFPLG